MTLNADRRPLNLCCSETVDDLTEFMHIKRLRKHRVDFERGVSSAVFVVQMCGQDNDPATKIFSSQTFDQLKARHFRHLMIDNKHIKRFGIIAYFGEGFVGAKRESKSSIGTAECKRQCVSHSKFVVNAQNIQWSSHKQPK